ncbi:hypothetical protein LINGRAHAP2_LOCUS9794 [Linum grandiflorum]
MGLGKVYAAAAAA